MRAKKKHRQAELEIAGQVLTCRACGATPERRGDVIAADAQGYSCSACCAGHPEPKEEAVP